MVKLLMILPVVSLALYPSLSHPPIFLTVDGNVTVDCQSMEPTLLKMRAFAEASEVLVIDSTATWHRFSLPWNDFSYEITCGNYSASGKISAPSKNTRFYKLLIYGDTRNDAKGVQRRIVEEGYKRGVLAVLHLGDIAFTDLDDGDWSRFFSALSGKLVFTAPGNHEFPGFRYSTYLYPSDYSFQVGKYNFIVVDGGVIPPVLVAQIRRNYKEGFFNVLVIHEPLYTCSKHSSDVMIKLAGKVVEELRRLGVRYVISSHDHNYQRIERNGIVQLVFGGGGAPLRKVFRCEGLKKYYEGYSYAIFDYEDGLGRITVYDLDGNVLDEVVLR